MNNKRHVRVYTYICIYTHIYIREKQIMRHIIANVNARAFRGLAAICSGRL